MRIRPPFSQNGAPIHRVRTHSLSRVRDSYGELINADVSDDPFLDLLQALWSQVNASQLLLQPPEEEVVQVSWIH